MDTSSLKPPSHFINIENKPTENAEDVEDSIFEPFEKNTWENRTFLFQEEIAKRFGFVATNIGSSSSKQPSLSSSTTLFSTDHQYIHCTGNMFLLIPTQLHSQVGLQGIRSRPKLPRAGAELSLNREQVPSLKRKDTEKISRHMDSSKPMYDHSETGFLWSWNFTVSKRWKQSSNTVATGDIPYMDKMLADFRDFCSNKDDRLKKFWDESWRKKQVYEELQNSDEKSNND